MSYYIISEKLCHVQLKYGGTGNLFPFSLKFDRSLSLVNHILKSDKRRTEEVGGNLKRNPPLNPLIIIYNLFLTILSILYSYSHIEL